MELVLGGVGLGRSWDAPSRGEIWGILVVLPGPGEREEEEAQRVGDGGHPWSSYLRSVFRRISPAVITRRW